MGGLTLVVLNTFIFCGGKKIQLLIQNCRSELYSVTLRSKAFFLFLVYERRFVSIELLASLILKESC